MSCVLRFHVVICSLKYLGVVVNITSRKMLSVLRNWKDNSFDMLFKEKVWHKFTGICPKVEMLECYEISLYNFIVFYFTFLQWKCNWSQVYKIPCFHLEFFVYNLFQDAKIEMDILPSEMYLSTTMLYQIFCVNFLKKRLCQRRSSFVIIRVLQGCVLPETVCRGK